VIPRLFFGFNGRSDNTFDIGLTFFVFLFQERVVVIVVGNIFIDVAQIRDCLFVFDVCLIVAGGFGRLHLIETDELRFVGSRCGCGCGCGCRFDDFFLNFFLDGRRRFGRFFTSKRFAANNACRWFTTKIVKLGPTALAMSFFASRGVRHGLSPNLDRSGHPLPRCVPAVKTKNARASRQK